MSIKSGHRTTIHTERAHVKVMHAGTILAETDEPVLLDETGLPTRYYFSPDDVRTDLLEPTDKHTTCPFKGVASYWTAKVGDDVLEDVVWSYPEPIPEADGIKGLLCFYSERVDLEVS
jgi:uncharacterized protein (DUF427 family)